jgi:hypothetical protein
MAKPLDIKTMYFTKFETPNFTDFETALFSLSHFFGIFRVLKG